MTPSTRRSAIAVALAAVLLGIAAPRGLGASITLVGPSPADGAVLPTPNQPTEVTVAWELEASGCTALPVTARPIFEAPFPVESQAAVNESASAQSYNFILDRANVRISWYVTMTCPGLAPVRSAKRTFTIRGPNTQPRLAGRYRALGSQWRFTPRCGSGACTTRVRISGLPAITLSYNPKTRRYSGRLRNRAAGRPAICRITRAGETIRTHRDLYRGDVRLLLNVSRVQIPPAADGSAGVRAFATVLKGRFTRRYIQTPKAKRLGCRGFTRSSGVSASRL
jgi:hypothetical protein